jgi:2-polyprenyl-3-methyl-5-hydroxy-6-metoxy-1,4-benzoquinol methylase
MTAPLDRIRDDFDRIARALAAADAGDALQPHERALLAYVPRGAQVLEVGCGHGALTRHLARRARSVLALDISPKMIEVARSRSAGHPNIAYRLADVTATALPEAAFDVVLSVATLHHVPLDPTVRRLAASVRPGGVLLVQDLLSRDGPRNAPLDALAWIARLLRGAPSTRRDPIARTLAKLYEEHGRDERYLTPPEVARVYGELLPGARVVHHIEWRYTVVWRRRAD